MKFGFIHNNNSGLIKELATDFESLRFSINATDDIDSQITEFIKNSVASSGVSALFIKLTLSQNYMELLGLRLALHIRLSSKFNQINTLPIILLGEEKYEELDRMTTFSGSLSSPGLYLSRETNDQVNKFISLLKSKDLKGCESIQDLVEKINIEPPVSYLSHHSIANEWSILRWAKVLGIDHNTEFNEVRARIENLLYYKYLQAKYPIQSDAEQTKISIDDNQKVLLIDDEWNKGWKHVLNTMFNPTTQNKSKFETFEFDFKDKTEEELINACKNRIKEFDPNIIILDLRLIDKDFQQGIIIGDLSGIKILKAAKEINEGIRVIAFSASNKISSLLELQNAGVNGFILKEAPELTVNKNGTSELIRTFKAAINEQSKYFFQKNLFQKCEQIQKILINQEVEENDKYDKLIKHLQAQLRVICSSLKTIDVKITTSIDIAFLACYNFLEIFKTYYVIEDIDYRFYLGLDRTQLYRYDFDKYRFEGKAEYIQSKKGDKPTWFHICAALFIDYFKISKSPYNNEITILKKLSLARNKYIHNTKIAFTIVELEWVVDSMLLACKKIRE